MNLLEKHLKKGREIFNSKVFAIPYAAEMYEKLATEVWEAGYSEGQDACIVEHTLAEQTKCHEEGYDAALTEVDKILQDELALAHTTKSGKTSRLTSAIMRIKELRK